MTIIPVTIAPAGTLSNGVAMPGTLLGLQIPTGLTSTIIYLQASLWG